MRDISNTMSSLISKLDQEIEKRELVYSMASEDWRESDRGAEYKEFTEKLIAMRSDVTDWEKEISSKL